VTQAQRCAEGLPADCATLGSVSGGVLFGPAYSFPIALALGRTSVGPRIERISGVFMRETSRALLLIYASISDAHTTLRLKFYEFNALSPVLFPGGADSVPRRSIRFRDSHATISRCRMLRAYREAI